jgi:hypothetical protein
MNIFVLHEQPRLAAQYYCDKHTPKLVIELAQLICTAMQFRGLTYKQYPVEQIEWEPGTVGYKNTHVNHPASVWLRATDENLMWAWEHFIALSDEYTKRYKKIHKTTQKLCHMSSYAPIPFSADYTKHTPFVQCMPEKYRISGDAITAYRNYYIGEKSKFAKWNYTKMPDWFVI